MEKLHQLLAVDSSTKGQAQKCRADLQNTMEKKRHLFEEKRITFISNKEGEPAVTREQKDIQTTVRKEVKWISTILVKAFDSAYAIDIANTLAKADIVLEDGTVLVTDVPATALLQLEKRVKEVQELIMSIPTLDPAKGFKLDDLRDPGIYAAREVHKNSTQKIQEPLVLAPATDKHPAQVQLVSKDVTIGNIVEQEWSALLTPAMKGDLMDNVEVLARGVAKARAKANEQEVDARSIKIGQKLLDYVFKPLSA